MSKITVDQSLFSKLNGLNSQIELCDPSGKTLGYFVPTEELQKFVRAEDYKKLLCEWARLKYPPEELKRIAEEPGGRTTAEVLARLNQLRYSRLFGKR